MPSEPGMFNVCTHIEGPAYFQGRPVFFREYQVEGIISSKGRTIPKPMLFFLLNFQIRREMSTGFDIDRGLLYPDGGYGPNTWSNQQWFSGLFIRNKLSFAYYRTEFLFESSVYYTSTESLQIFLPGSSKCIKSVSFQPKNLQYLAGIFNISGRSRYPQVGGHLTTFKRITDLTISKRSRLESPGTKYTPEVC